MHRSRSGPRALIALVGVVAIVAAACGGSAAIRRPKRRRRRARPPRRRRRADRPRSPSPRSRIDASVPGPNGGTVVRWFVGLGAGGQPQQIAAETGLRRRLQQRSAEGQSTSRSRSTTTTSRPTSSRPRSPPATRRTSSARSASRASTSSATSCSTCSRSSSRPSFDMSKFDPSPGRLLQDRQGRRHDRRPVRDLPVVHLLQQEAVRRGRAAVPADQGRRPVRGQAVGHGRRPRARHEAHRRQERQRRHERRLRRRPTSSSGASTCSGPTTAPTAETALFGASSFVAADGKTAQIPDAIADRRSSGSTTASGRTTSSRPQPDQQRPAGQGQPVPVGQPRDDRDPQLVHLLRQPGRPGQADRRDTSAGAVAPSYNGTTTAKLHADTFSILKTTKDPDAAFKALAALVASAELLTIYGALPADPAQQQPFFDVDRQELPGRQARLGRPAGDARLPRHAQPPGLGPGLRQEPRPPGRRSRTSTGRRRSSTSTPSSTR